LEVAFSSESKNGKSAPMPVGTALTAPAFAYPASGMFARKELFLWFAAILCTTSVSQNVGRFFEEVPFALPGFGVFQILAWWAVFSLLGRETSGAPATRQDFVVVGSLCIINMMPAERTIWIAATLVAVYIHLTSMKGSNARAAATVLLALCIQTLWGPAVFSFFAPDLLQADAAIVGTALDVTQSGFTWHANIIATEGHSVELFNGCSSFHNISLAVLCWVTQTKLKRPAWIATDFLFGAAACVAMIALNATRIYLMALSFEGYEYWHNGNGAVIFEVGASLTIMLISLWGSSIGDPQHT
jgi:hypothetical protein